MQFESVVSIPPIKPKITPSHPGREPPELEQLFRLTSERSATTNEHSQRVKRERERAFSVKVNETVRIKQNVFCRIETYISFQITDTLYLTVSKCAHWEPELSLTSVVLIVKIKYRTLYFRRLHNFFSSFLVLKKQKQSMYCIQRSSFKPN